MPHLLMIQGGNTPKKLGEPRKHGKSNPMQHSLCTLGILVPALHFICGYVYDMCLFVCVCCMNPGTYTGGQSTSSDVSPHCLHCWGQGPLVCCCPHQAGRPMSFRGFSCPHLHPLADCWDHKCVPLCLASHAFWGLELRLSSLHSRPLLAKPSSQLQTPIFYRWRQVVPQQNSHRSDTGVPSLTLSFLSNKVWPC